MITYTELRRLSLDFRRLSSNFLNSTDDTAATMIQRFKKYIDDTPFISGIISDAIGEVDYDWQNCFRQSKHSGWHEIEVPVDEACHVKAMYDYLDYIISNRKRFCLHSAYKGKSNRANNGIKLGTRRYIAAFRKNDCACHHI